MKSKIKLFKAIQIKLDLKSVLKDFLIIILLMKLLKILMTFLAPLEKFVETKKTKNLFSVSLKMKCALLILWLLAEITLILFFIILLKLLKLIQHIIFGFLETLLINPLLIFRCKKVLKFAKTPIKVKLKSKGIKYY
jgi:hypothetical protein